MPSDNADTIEGLAGADTMDGGGGNDTLRGGTGGDKLIGGGGDDVFQLSGSEVTGDSFDGGAGFDRIVNLSATGGVYGVGNFIPVSVEEWSGNSGAILADANANTLDFSGTKLVNVAYVDGGQGDDLIKGNDLSNDDLRGFTGNDQLFGNGGNDTLSGGEGNDTVNGGLGADRLTGGGGYDVFRYSALGETGLGLSTDTVTDFNAGTATSSYDKLDFRGLGLTFNPSGSFAGGDQASIIAVQGSGTQAANTLIEIDGNGDAAADHEVILQSVNHVNIDASDFLLV